MNSPSIKDFHSELCTYRYGTLYGRFPYNYSSIEPILFRRYKRGVCWDFVAAEVDFFDKYYPDIKYDVYYIETEDGTKCHSVLVYETRLKQYAVFEACRPPRGIYEFRNLEDAIKYITTVMVKKDSDNVFAPYIIFKYNIPTEYNLDTTEYMKHVYHTGEVIHNNSNYLEMVSGK